VANFSRGFHMQDEVLTWTSKNGDTTILPFYWQECPFQTLNDNSDMLCNFLLQRQDPAYTLWSLILFVSAGYEGKIRDMGFIPTLFKEKMQIDYNSYLPYSEAYVKCLNSSSIVKKEVEEKSETKYMDISDSLINRRSSWKKTPDDSYVVYTYFCEGKEVVKVEKTCENISATAFIFNGSLWDFLQ